MDNAIQIEHLDFSYGPVTVLENASLSVGEREFICVVGPNGGGKTTLLKLMLGLLEPKRGTVRIFGRAKRKGSFHLMKFLRDALSGLCHWASGGPWRALAPAAFFFLVITGVGLRDLAAQESGESTPPAESTAVASASAEPGQSAIDWGAVVEQNSFANWVALLVLIFAGLLAGKIAGLILGRTGKRLEGTRAEAVGSAFQYATAPIQLLFFGVFLGIGLAQITMSTPLNEFCGDVVALLIYAAVFWYAYNLVGLIDRVLRKMAEKTESDLDDIDRKSVV